MNGPSGYTSSEDRARDAFVILNEMMGELHAARLVDLFASEKFLDSPKVNGLAEVMPELNRIYMRRLSLSAVASVMTKFIELYERFLRPLNCASDDAKALLGASKEELYVLRNINQHLIDKDTGRHHSVEKIEEVFTRLSKRFNDLFGGDISNLIGRLESYRNLVVEKYPAAKSAVADRYQKLQKNEVP